MMTKQRRPGKKSDYPKTVKAYAAYYPETGIIWGSIMPKAEWTRSFWERHNAGSPPPLYVAVRVILPKNLTSDHENPGNGTD